MLIWHSTAGHSASRGVHSCHSSVRYTNVLQHSNNSLRTIALLLDVQHTNSTREL